MGGRNSLKTLRIGFFSLFLPVIFCLFFHGFVSSTPATLFSGECTAVSPDWPDAEIRLILSAEGDDDNAPPIFPEKNFETGLDGDDGQVDNTKRSVPFDASPIPGRWFNHHSLDPGYIRSVFRPPDRVEIADSFLFPPPSHLSPPRRFPCSGTTSQRQATTHYGRSFPSLLLRNIGRMFSVRTATAATSLSIVSSEDIIPLADLVRIGDDLDYNTYHDDHFVVNTPSGISWQKTFDVVDFQTISSAHFKYTVAGSMVGNPIYINGKQAGKLCVGGNAAWDIKDCSLNILPYIQAGQNQIKITCAKYVYDDITPYDDVEIYDLYIEFSRFPVAPTLTLPTNASAEYYRNVRLQWNIADHAAGYQIAVGDSCNVVGSITSPTNSYLLNGLIPDKTYFWKVRGYNTANIFGPWSTCFSFKAIHGCPSCSATNLLLLGGQ
jgi:hypothetical protein